MKESIKKRIEAVRRGEVPEGYCKVHPYVIPYDWNVVKLGNVTKQTSRSNKDGQGRPAYSINNRKGFVPQSEQFEEGSYEDLDKTAYKIVRKGEFAYNPARVNVGSIGRLRDAEEVAVSSLYVCVRVDDKVDGKFFNAWTKSRDFYKETVRNTEGSVREYLFYENFANMRIPIPTVAEQQKIAEILETCDRMIELKQSKIDELNKLKQVFLLEMFPQKGQTIPKRRFPGFSTPWEQRKFSDLVETRRGLTYKPTDIREKGVRVLRSSNIDEDRFVLKPDDVFVDESAINIDFAKENDILITAANGSSRLVGKHAIVSEISDKSTVHGGFMLLGTSDEPYFANAFMSSAWYKRFIDLYVSGGNGAIGNLNKSDLDDQDILVPQKKEQQAIGHFFENLDRLITLHQRELAEVGKYKKALMQLLLTGLVRVNA